MVSLSLVAGVGLFERTAPSASASGTADCSSAAASSMAFQATVTRHRLAGVKALLDDTEQFAHRVREEHLLSCPSIEAFRTGGSQGVDALCRVCATRLAVLLRPVHSYDEPTAAR